MLCTKSDASPPQRSVHAQRARPWVAFDELLASARMFPTHDAVREEVTQSAIARFGGRGASPSEGGHPTVRWPGGKSPALAPRVLRRHPCCIFLNPDRAPNRRTPCALPAVASEEARTSPG